MSMLSPECPVTLVSIFVTTLSMRRIKKYNFFTHRPWRRSSCSRRSVHPPPRYSLTVTKAQISCIISTNLTDFFRLEFSIFMTRSEQLRTCLSACLVTICVIVTSEPNIVHSSRIILTVSSPSKSSGDCTKTRAIALYPC